VERYLEEKLNLFKVLLDLTREQDNITREKDIDLKKLNLILKQKDAQINKIKGIDQILRTRKGSTTTNENPNTLAQIIKDLLSLEESSYRNLYSNQSTLKDELLDHHGKRGLKKLYANRPKNNPCPKFIERNI
jgi:hypothetical protein